MSTPEASQVFNSFDPKIDSGVTLSIAVSQTLTKGDQELLDTSAGESGESKVHLRVEGPQVGLLASDIAGVFPSPGSDNSPDEFLPHIALTRRTLPWERQGPTPALPWLAILLLKDSELGSMRGKPITATTVGAVKDTHDAAYLSFQNSGLTDATAIDVVYAPTSVLNDVLASDVIEEDLRFLCHVRRVAQDNPLAMLDDDRDLAVVVGGRLPDAGDEDEDTELHHAYLVSLEKRSDLLSGLTGATTPLIALHYWTFTPSKSGDFEEVIKAIRVRPLNGGVLRFGNLPRNHDGTGPELSGGFAAMLDDSGYLVPQAELHQKQQPVEYRGPLRPFAPHARSKGFAIRPAPEEFVDAEPGDPPDYSHAAAFELGRLATLAGEGLVDDLHQVKYGQLGPHWVVPIEYDSLPDAFRLPEWVENEQWWGNPYSVPGAGPLLEPDLLKQGEADFTGIAVQSAPWKQTVIDQIEKLAGIEQPSSGPIDIGVVNEQLLHGMFAEVVAATTSK